MPGPRPSIDLRRLSGRIEQVPRATVIAAVRAAKAVARSEGGSVRLWRKRSSSYRPVTLRAVDDVRPTDDGFRARVQGVPVGPWVWQNTGTRRHVIGAGRRGKVYGPTFGPRRGAVLSFARDQVARGPVVHPGRTGRRRWRTVAQRTERIAVEAFQRNVSEAMR